MSDIDEILKAALSPKKYPSEKLNEQIFMKMKESGNMRLKKRQFMIAAAVILLIFIVPVSAYAAYRYLLPKDAARVMEDEKLGDAFEKDGTEVLQTVTDGSYQVTYLGNVTGESISERTGSAWELHPDRIYVAVAIEKADGTDMTEEESSNIFVSPLIQGLQPWTYNIASMNGSYMAKVIEGVLYRIIECDNIEIFADKKLYLAVSDTAFFSIDAFDYDEKTGLITENAAYKGTNILFDLKLDSSKADPVKAKEYLEQLEKEWNQGADSQDEDSSQANTGTKEETTEENPRIQQEVFSDTDNQITFHVKDNDSSKWWGGEEQSQTALHYYFQVEGDNIDSITYQLNKGEFCSYPEHNLGEIEHYGDNCSVTYDEQKDRDYLYTILFSAKYADYGYDPDEVSELGYKDLEARNKIYYDVLNQEIESTEMNLEIKMKDGSTVNKTLTFDNVLDDTVGSFWIAVSVE